MRWRLGLTAGLVLFVAAAAAAAPAAGREVRVAPSALALPELQRLALVAAGTPGPGAKGYRPAAEVTAFADALRVPAEGPYDLWWQPRGDGLAVRVAAGLKLAAGTTTVKMDDHIGMVRVRGDDLPRAKLIALTAPDAPGPDAADFRPVQTAPALRRDLVVPAGFYALWLKPAVGGKARKLEGKLRVGAGKLVEIE